MKYLPLIWAGLTRKKARTLLTLLSVITAFALFGMLDAVRVAFNAPGSVSGINRLIVASKFSIIQPLPFSYLTRIRAIPGVVEVAYANWFGGIYQDEKNFFANIAVSPQQFLDLHDEFVLAPEQKQAFLNTRTGAIVGTELANRFGWKVGDKIPLRATIFPNKDGSNIWTFDLVGIFRTSDPALKGMERQMFFRYDYFDEGRQLGQGTVGWYIVKVANPSQASSVALAIDHLFVNSSDETKTQSEREFQLSFARQIGDIGLIVSAIMGAVFFTLALLTGNTMAQGIRERIPELAVLKTIGFTNESVLMLVLAESIALLLGGGLTGLVVAKLSLPLMAKATDGMLTLPLRRQTWVLGLVLMLVMGVAVGLPPALRAMRLNIVDALAGR
jgi:putative ABC transport system permease protein